MQKLIFSVCIWQTITFFTYTEIFPLPDAKTDTPLQQIFESNIRKTLLIFYPDEASTETTSDNNSD